MKVGWQKVCLCLCVCAFVYLFVVRIWYKQVFSWRGSYNYLTGWTIEQAEPLNPLQASHQFMEWEGHHRLPKVTLSQGVFLHRSKLQIFDTELLLNA